MIESNESEKWFAMRATFNRSIRAKNELEGRGIECYIPMRYEVVKQRNGHKSKLLVPAISSLLFVHATRSEIGSAKQRMDYLQFMTCRNNGNNEPIIVPDNQMASFITVTSSQPESISYLRPDEVNIPCGTKVRIIGGAFNAVEGVYIKSRGRGRKKLLVELPGIIAAKTEIVDYDLIEVLE